MLYALVFVLAFALNAVSARETRATAKLQSREAALWSGLMDVLLWVEFAIVIRVNLWLSIPSVLGGITGTYWSVERKKIQSRLKRKRRAERDRERRMAASGVGDVPSDTGMEGDALDEDDEDD